MSIQQNFSFDYNNVSSEQQDAIKAVLMNLEVSGQLTPELEKSMKVRFGIEDPDMVPVEESKFYQLARNFGIYCSEEGYVTDVDKGKRIPSLRIQADVEKLDAFLEFARINLNTLDQQEIEQDLAEDDAARLAHQRDNTTDISEEEIAEKVAYEESLREKMKEVEEAHNANIPKEELIAFGMPDTDNPIIVEKWRIDYLRSKKAEMDEL